MKRPSPWTRAAVLAGALALATAGVSACQDTSSSRRVPASQATSAANVGGMKALVAAAQREGRLNTTTLLPHWANYGGLITGFEKKYGITIVNSDPFGPSQQEINDIKRYRGQERAPDVLDLGDSFAESAARQNLLAPYRSAMFDQLADNQRDAKARWYNSYGGYVSIGCDAKRVKVCPNSFADLLKPRYKNMVALNGNPTTAGSAFAGVNAAALANGGSFDNVQPGLDFFARLTKVGNYNRGNPNPASIAQGKTPISIEWDFLNLDHAQQLRSKNVDWRVSIPFDGSFSEYYAQAINKYAPHPAAARLWEEYVQGVEGQNLRLAGFARPVLMASMAKNGTLDKAAAAKLPTVEGTPTFPSAAQLAKALKTIRQGWDTAVGTGG